MRRCLISVWYRAYIRMLLLFSPVTLFQKISQLDWYSQTLKDWATTHLDDEHRQVLDVGCATGYLTEYLYTKNYFVAGVDQSAKMIESARKKNTQIDYRVADACRLPYEDESFDVVLSASLINIVSDPAVLIEELSRVGKKDGWIMFLFPVVDFTDDDMAHTRERLGLSGFSAAALSAWYRLAPKMSTQEVVQQLNRAGFSDCHTSLYLNGMLGSVSASKNTRS